MVVLALVLPLAAVVAGLLYQQIGLRRDRRRFPPPGQLLRVGAHRLHVICRGEGGPSVLLEAGLAASSISWALVEAPVAAFTRVCTYDRAGLGWSEPPSSPRTFDATVNELSAVLDHLASGEPCVLVGHSFGAFVVRALAMRHPERIVGLVLVDPAVEWLKATPQRDRLLRGGRHLARMGGVLAHIGVVRACMALLSGGAPGAPRQFVRIFGPTAAAILTRLVGEVRKLPAELHPVVQALWCEPKCFGAMAGNMDVLRREVAQIAGVATPPAIPVVVISSADQPAEQLHAHHRLAAECIHGRHVVATRGAHWVQFDEPELVVTVIREMVMAHRPPAAQNPYSGPSSVRQAS